MMRDVLRTGAVWALLAATVSVVALGCGDGSGETEGPTVSLQVTRDFGREVIVSEEDVALEGHETMWRLLKDYADVETYLEGREIASIDGVQSDTEEGTIIWQSFVNGIETDPEPKDYELFDGDVVQWDLRDAYVTLDVRHTVAAFPETFTRGFNGKRFPVRTLCEKPSSDSCRHVKRVLNRATSSLEPPSKRSVYDGRVLVGKWSHWRSRTRPGLVGPRFSGIFARFPRNDEELRLLDWNAHYVRTLRGDVGLVAAARPTEVDFVWVVTGLTDAGVARAARALDARRLHNAYAIAVTPDGDIKLPLEPPR